MPVKAPPGTPEVELEWGGVGGVPGGAKRPDSVRISHLALTSDKRLGRAGRAGRRELAGCSRLSRSDSRVRRGGGGGGGEGGGPPSAGTGPGAGCWVLGLSESS